MSLTVDMCSPFLTNIHQIIDYTWLGGAAAGLRLSGRFPNQQAWIPFIGDLVEVLDTLGDVPEIAPGEVPQLGSPLDSLAGYISVMGDISVDGLSFPVPFEVVSIIMRQLACINASHHHGRIIVPQSELESLSHLLHLRGPIAQQLQEVLDND
jgi:hypothetical protein